MVGPNFRLLLTVIILQFKNHTNTESSLPLLRVCHLEEACEGEFLGGQWNSSSYRPASLTGKTVREKQYTEESVLWPHPKAPLCTARALLHSRESLKDWCFFPPPLQVQLTLSFQECTPPPTRRGGISSPEEPERIKQGEGNLSRFSLWEFFMDAPCHDRSGIHPSVSHNASAHLPWFCLGLPVSSGTNMAQVIHTTCWLSWLFFLVPKVFATEFQASYAFALGSCLPLTVFSTPGQGIVTVI